MAVRKGSLEIVELLLNQHASINEKDHDGLTPLHITAENDDYEIADFLIRHGAEINALDEKGNTPLHLACEKEKLKPQKSPKYFISGAEGVGIGALAAGIDIILGSIIAFLLIRGRVWGKGILDAMNDGVYIVNQRNEIQYINPVMEREFGPVKGRKCHEYLNDLPEVCSWCKNHEVFAGKTVRWEWHFFKTGKTYDLIDTPIVGPDGTLCKLGISRDISDRKRSEEALRERGHRNRRSRPHRHRSRGPFQVYEARLACGGTVKGSSIELQGNHRERVKELLTEKGYSVENIC
jgi:hypothetical protein